MVTNIQLVAATTIPNLHSRLLRGRDSNDKYDNAYFVAQGEWACSPAALSALKPAFSDAQRLAQAAIDALQVSGVETSDAFANWFGDSNASPQVVTELLNEHFKPAMTHFLFPSFLAAVAFQDEGVLYQTRPQDPEPSDDSLVFACPPATQSPADICGPFTHAGVFEQFSQNSDGSVDFVGPTMLSLCPPFFQSTTTLDQMVQTWKAGLTIEPMSRGFTLLHELQHMRKTTSPNPKADDVQNPNDSGSGCYSPGCCAALPGADKIRNAQNYALFALDVLTFPERAKPQS
ncbi:hypothetical protein LY76DRAFT_528119, partial [Colletotrichum caudatum]